MSVNSAAFLEVYASHTAAALPHEVRAQNQVAEARREERRPPTPAFGLSPLAPPYQVYPARNHRRREKHAA